MEKIKTSDDISGYGFASDDHRSSVLSFSDFDATDITLPAHFNGKHIGQRPPDDHAHRIIDITVFHFIFDFVKKA